MKLEIKEHKKNPLMNREEYMITLDHSGKATPSRQEILKDIAKETKAKEDVIIIDKIMSRSSIPVSEVTVFVYNKKDAIPNDKLEKMKKRMKVKTETPKEEAAPAPTENEAEKKEPVAEEKVEETKVEEELKEEKPVEKEETKTEETPVEEKKEETEEPAKEKE